MPHPPRRPAARRSVRALICAVTAALALPAAAHACAPATGGSPAFAQFGDAADYTLLQGGSFEDVTDGWSLTGAAVVLGNESFGLHGASDAHSLLINPAGAAVSPLDVRVQFLPARYGGAWVIDDVYLDPYSR